MSDLTRPALEFTAEQARAAIGPHQPVKVAGVHIPHIIAAPGETLQNVEKLQEYRARFRGKFTTKSVDDFVAYTKKRAGDTNIEYGKPAVFIDGERMTATAFFNLGDNDKPGHGDDTGALELPKTGPFGALWDILDERVDQRKLAEFLEDWRENIAAYSNYHDEGDEFQPMRLSAAISAVRNVTIEERQLQDSTVGNFNAERTALESVEARSKFVLPPFLQFSCEPYMDLPRRHMLLRLSVLTSGTIGFVLRLVREPDVLEAIAQDFKERLQAGLGDVADATVGTFTVGA